MNIRGYDEWGPKPCPECGAEPYTRCKTPSGADASLPHKARWPERPVPLYGKRKQRKLELQDQERLKEAKKLPVSVALRTIEDTVMEGFRRKREAA